MSVRSKTVVPFDPAAVSQGYERFGRHCMDLEPKICDLVRVCDLAEHVCISEMGGNTIADDGSVLQLVLEDLTRRAKDLKELFYQRTKSA
jgi:hypothetical protein